MAAEKHGRGSVQHIGCKIVEDALHGEVGEPHRELTHGDGRHLVHLKTGVAFGCIRGGADDDGLVAA